MAGCPKSGNTFMKDVFKPHLTTTPIPYRGMPVPNNEDKEINIKEFLQDNIFNNCIQYLYSPHGTMIIPQMKKRLKELGYTKIYVVHLIRDGRNVVASFMNHSGYTDNPKLAAKQWVGFIDLKNKYEEDSLVIYYEDFISNMQETIDKICEFANIESFDAPIQAIKKENNTWDKLTKEQQELAFPILEKTLIDEGYK